jgi:hypothetical protein
MSQSKLTTPRRDNRKIRTKNYTKEHNKIWLDFPVMARLRRRAVIENISIWKKWWTVLKGLWQLREDGQLSNKKGIGHIPSNYRPWTCLYSNCFDHLSKSYVFLSGQWHEKNCQINIDKYAFGTSGVNRWSLYKFFLLQYIW